MRRIGETMEWKWGFWLGEANAILDGAKGRARRAEPRSSEEWEARLIDAGVAAQWAERLAERLSAKHADLGRGSAVALIEGAALAVEMQAATQASVERNMRDVREVERLLGAFTGELEKLDEVLEVLAAYAQRMRANPAKTTRRTLH